MKSHEQRTSDKDQGASPPAVAGRGPSTGIDIVYAPRVAALARNERFLKRVFTEGELLYSLRKKPLYRRLAGRLAAKEACLKALSAMTGGAAGGSASKVRWTEMEVVTAAGQRPVLRLHGRAREILGGGRAHLSIAYSRSAAIALVAIE
jgi:holo-[acyl-carrier protein] synthase